MNPRPGLPLALCLLVLLGTPISAIAAPRDEVSGHVLPENPTPSYLGSSSGSFSADQYSDWAPNQPVPHLREPGCVCDASFTPVEKLQLTLTTYRTDGRTAIDLPRVPGTPNLPIGSARWAPQRLYGPLLSGVRAGGRKVDQLAAGTAGIPSHLLRLLPGR